MESVTCPLCCSRDFKSRKELLDHLNYVNSNLKCPICTEQSQDLSSLILHLEIQQCWNESEASSRPNSTQNETSAQMLLENKNFHKQIKNNTSDMSRENRVVLMRKRRKSNISLLSKRKTPGKNNNANEVTSETNNITYVIPTSSSDIGEGTPTLEQENTVTCEPAQNQNGVSQFNSVSQPTQGSTADSEVDLDNVSMLSDESSFATTNDYSSSQNEIISDEETENAVGFPNRTFSSNSHVALFRNNSVPTEASHGIVNNLQVINNNFYTILLNNGSYEGNSANENIPHERNRNYQRRNTKNNNSQLNNYGTSSSEHSALPLNVSMHNNLQVNRSCKNSNLTPLNYTNLATTSSLPTTSNIFTISNNSPHKYAVKNTNISNGVPVGSKEVRTANLESRNTSRQSASVENSTDIAGTQVVSRVNDEGVREDATSSGSPASASPVTENAEASQEPEQEPGGSHNAGHPIVSRSTSNRMQKIQNADCIQNSSHRLNPSTSALCKTNSFPLCNYIYIGGNRSSNKCKLIKYNENHAGVTSRVEQVILNNVQTQHIANGNHQMTQVGNPMTMVNNDIRETTSSDSAINQNMGKTNSIHNGRQDAGRPIHRNEYQSEANFGINETEQSRGDSSVSDGNSDSFETNVSSSSNINVCSNRDSNQKSVDNVRNMSEITPTNEITPMLLKPVDSNVTLPPIDDANNETHLSNTFDNIPSTLNNLNNNATSQPTTSQNICSLTNNLHKNKKSNLNQLGTRHVSKDEKLFSSKEVSQTGTAASSESGYQTINNSIERNFNKLNSCSQEINAHKHVKSVQSNKRGKKCKRTQSEEIERRQNSDDLNVGSAHSIGSNSSYATHSHPVDSNKNATASDVIPGNASTTSNSNEAIASTSNHRFDMNNLQNTHNAVFNNKNTTIKETDKSLSSVFNKKDLVNIKRNNFNPQDHSNVTRSNSMNVRVNDLTSGFSSGSQHFTSGTPSHSELSDTKNTTRTNIAKSNSFTIRNNIIDDRTGSNVQERNAPSDKNQKVISQVINNKNNNVCVSNRNSIHKTGFSDNASWGESSFHSRDSLEPFRLDEASNDCDEDFLDGNKAAATQKDDGENVPVELLGHRVMNNTLENVEIHGGASGQFKPGCSSYQGNSSSSGATSSPRMIHNNIEPRCKKNKKCNEERGPLKPINSENEQKPSDG